MRQLTKIEQDRLKILTENSVSVALIEPTATGLKKSIMDATGTVRNYLKEQKFHDYSLQKQGQQDKVLIKAKIVTEVSLFDSTASLYRPITKKGDPRIWFTGLTKMVVPNDIIALIGFDSQIFVLNLSKLPVEKLINSPVINPFQDLVKTINALENAIANELLIKLRKLCLFGFIPSSVNADTAVGRTLETALGIPINSSRLPDYKGIELKSFRHKEGKSGNRKTLFAQVPDWKLSKFKSSAQILDTFGYLSDKNELQLNCTVSAKKRNPQSLLLRIDNNTNCLFENSDLDNIQDFAVWSLENLHRILLQKHNETFWIGAESRFINGIEHFHYNVVEHTQKPISSQFDILLDQGIITLDHLIKRDKKGKVKERGPLFKIKSDCLNLLFPPSKMYNLSK